jgi:hypothetical protein
MLARLNALPACIVALLLLTVVPRSRAQTPADPPLAPVPTQILTAKTVFISNVSGDFPVPAGTPDLTYNKLYSDMKSWGRFTLVSAPADSDLVFEIRFASSVSSTDTISRLSSENFYFSLRILDARSHFVLWAFSSNVPQSANRTKSRQFFDQAMTALVDDVKKLAQPVSTVSAPAKN